MEGERVISDLSSQVKRMESECVGREVDRLLKSQEKACFTYSEAVIQRDYMMLNKADLLV